MNAMIRIVVVVALIHICSGLSTTKAGSTLTRYNQFISTLTTLLSDGSTRAVHSSGGAAGGVVSEGQGYGLLIGGITAASLGTSSASFDTVATQTYQMFLGWKKMCKLSADAGSCQATTPCTESTNSHHCLPHWKFDDSITAAGSTGNAPDGDEDAIVGMIALVMVTEPVKSKYTWWKEVAQWAYQSCQAFYTYNTAIKVINGVTYPMLKLGACWGGWDCNNPSYHAPGAYRAFRDYIARYASTFGDSTSVVTDYTTKYNNLIATSYAVILADQCDTTGLTTNWYVPNNDNPNNVGTTGCSGSGTAADQYGAEASRGVWRVVLDYLWYGNTANTANYLDPVIKQVTSKYSGSSFSALSTGCLVSSVFADWTASSNAFIFGPTLCALVKPLSSVTNQNAALDAAGSLVAGTSISAYYAGAWTAISTFTLNGDLERVGTIIRGGALPPPIPIPPPTPTPTPTPTPISPSSLTTYSCSYAYDNSFWIEFNLAAPTGAVVQAQCSDGRLVPCVYNLAKWQCNPSNLECLSPRNAIVKGVNPGCCSLGLGCSKATYAEEETNTSTTSTTELNAGLIAAVVVASVVLVALIGFIVYQVKTRYFAFSPMETY